ncbi:MAG: fluoride efflux transporter CrcB [Roseococcus sp.]
MNFAWVALGGALGSMGRYGVSLLALWLFGTAYPWGTLAVNVLGSLAIGVLAAQGVEGPARLFLVTGVLGGFTTFSAFSLEAALLWERAPWMGALYVAASLGLGLAGFALGWWLGR